MLVQSQDALIAAIYPNLATPGHATDELFCNSIILASRHDDVDVLNEKSLELLPGQAEVFHSTDRVKFEAGVDNADTAHLAPEYLKSLKSGSIPQAKLKLKLGCPVMIMRNLAPAQGVCNGTRGVVTRMGRRVLELRLLTGTEAGKF
jgi:ATP-dependent DNA helicase PIF1